MQALLRELAPQVLGALVRRHRDLAVCEDALQEALIAASAQWERQGVPDNPRGWLLQVANRRVVDTVRAEASRTDREQMVVSLVPFETQQALLAADDTLELFCMCCHPALSSGSATALTLRAVGGLTTAEIARAFLVPEATMAQRLSRARQTLREAEVTFETPEPAELVQRLGAVARVMYLIFNEGYLASSGDSLARVDLSNEAIRLARLLNQVLPDTPEVMGLLALMLLTEARRDARTGEWGELVPLEAQDRSRWSRELIAEGSQLITSAFEHGAVGPYQLQAAIAALHDEASSVERTDWPQILALYEALERLTPGPMVALNLAIAESMVRGPQVGLERLKQLETDPRLANGHRLDAARGHLLLMLGDPSGAAAAFTRAAAKAPSTAERNYLLLKATS